MLNLVATMLTVQVILLLLLRPLVLWYLKVNDRLLVLRSIDESLKCLPGVAAARAQMRRAS